MDEQKLTVQEAVELLLMSQSSVYSWIEKGKLKTVDSPTGKLIVISNKEIETIRELNRKSRRNKVSKQTQTNSDNLQDFTIIDAEYSKNDEVLLSNQEETSENQEEPQQNFRNIKQEQHSSAQPAQNTDVNLYLVQQLEKYALDAGQFRQLELIRKQERDDVEYYKSQYFALHSENIKLLARLESFEDKLNAQLEAKDIEITALRKQIEALQVQNSLIKTNSSSSSSENPDKKGEQPNSPIARALKKFFR